MGIFNKQRHDGATFDGQGEERKGLIDVIKYNGEADELVWKFPYENLSTAAQLVVNQSQEAIFLKGGDVADVFGPGTHTLSANNIPILQKLINLPFGGKTPFTAEVWYINKTVRRNLKFGTPKEIYLQDPQFGHAIIPVRSHGEYGIRVADSSALLKEMVGTLHLFTNDNIVDQFKSNIISSLSQCLTRYIAQERVSVLDLNASLSAISLSVREAVSDELSRFGIEVTNLNVTHIGFDPNDPSVKEVLEAKARRSRREEEGYNYQQERQLDIMETAAGNEGGAGQMMGAGMGLGMGFSVGGAFGQQMGNIAGVMNQQQPAQPMMPPPPPQAIAFHVLINNQQLGPYDLQALGRMAQNGQLTRETYVWRVGMAQWIRACECGELATLFSAMSPPPPPML
jgi:membrane protease subunit (stomatin/prohibitin family)